MTMRVISALLCDDVRQEKNGKYILIGAYTGEILYPRFPAAGQFSAMCCLEVGEPSEASIQFRFKVDDEIVGDITGEVGSDTPGRMWVALSLPPMSFPGACIVSAEFRVNDTGEWEVFMSMPVRRIENQSHSPD